MARSGHVAEIRDLVGTRRLLLPSVATAVFDGGRVLLVDHADGDHAWGLPGGAIEPGEHPADAAVREVYEETGVEVEILALAAVLGGPHREIHYDNGDRTVYVTTVFTARCRPGEVPDLDRDLDRSEVDGAAWFGRDVLERLEMERHAAEAVAAAFAVQLDGAPVVFAPATWRPS